MNPEESTNARLARTQAARNMAWLLGDKALALVIGLLVFSLIGRSLGPVGAGHFAYGSAILQTGLGLSLVCAGVVLLPRFCRMHSALPGALANVFVLRLAASLVAMIAMMLFCVATVDDIERRNVALIMLLAVALIEPIQVIATYWQSRNHNRPTVIARSSGLIVRALIVFAGVSLDAPAALLAAAWVVEAALNATLQYRLAPGVFSHARLRSFVRPSRLRLYFAFGVRFVPALWASHLFLRLDRLVLANWLDPHDFGIYAAPMQLVEVWVQVAYLVGSSVASAYVYKRLRNGERMIAFAVTAGLMVTIGSVGMAGAELFGGALLQLVSGPEFKGSLVFLVAGAGAAIFLFADQAVDLMILAQNHPRLLALKWGVALSVALLVFWFGFEHLGAYVGPLGLAAGIVAAWITLLLTPAQWRYRSDARPPVERVAPDSQNSVTPLGT